MTKKVGQAYWEGSGTSLGWESTFGIDGERNIWQIWKSITEVERKLKTRLSIGDVVLVHEENVKVSKWKMGKVVERIVGEDGVVRGAKLKVVTEEEAHRC